MERPAKRPCSETSQSEGLEGTAAKPRPRAPGLDVRIGVDFGGTKIEAIAIDAHGVERCRRRIDTPREDYEASVRAVAELVAAVERDAGGRGTVGVGIPGAVSPATGLIKNANSTWLIGRRLHLDLEAGAAIAVPRGVGAPLGDRRHQRLGRERGVDPALATQAISGDSTQSEVPL